MLERPEGIRCAHDDNDIPLVWREDWVRGVVKGEGLDCDRFHDVINSSSQHTNPTWVFLLRTDFLRMSLVT